MVLLVTADLMPVASERVGRHASASNSALLRELAVASKSTENQGLLAIGFQSKTCATNNTWRKCAAELN